MDDSLDLGLRLRGMEHCWQPGWDLASIMFAIPGVGYGSSDVAAMAHLA